MQFELSYHQKIPPWCLHYLQFHLSRASTARGKILRIVLMMRYVKFHVFVHISLVTFCFSSTTAALVLICSRLLMSLFQLLAITSIILFQKEDYQCQGAIYNSMALSEASVGSFNLGPKCLLVRHFMFSLRTMSHSIVMQTLHSQGFLK